MRVHLWREVDASLFDAFRASLPNGHTATQGTDAPPDTRILVAGVPPPDLLDRLDHLEAVVIPFVGLQPAAKEALSARPHLRVYNIHHNAAATAEKAIELLMAVAKKTVSNDRSMREADWSPRFDAAEAVQLAGKTALVLGYGEIGKRVAKACLGLDMKVMAVSRTGPNGEAGQVDTYGPGDLPSLWQRADCVLVCVPLTEETRGLVSAEALALLPSGAIVVNVGRGAVIDEEALYRALESGKLHGAGLDVWWQYPKEGETCRPSAFPFESLPNVVMSPHVGGTVQGTEPVRMAALSDLLTRLADDPASVRQVDLALGY